MPFQICKCSFLFKKIKETRIKRSPTKNIIGYRHDLCSVTGNFGCILPVRRCSKSGVGQIW